MGLNDQTVVLESAITCPNCGHIETETMPTDACQWFYECKSCSTVLKPLEGDCCVYCSYATVPCPPIQLGDRCCGWIERPKHPDCIYS
ncbi:MAG: GDCCVxC domain-containing (seleno)protein [Paracoccaceae bacterium]|nr:GDCCVxC domain-containing (seleno)protein [Paracoccaceae bacterium]